MKEGPIVVVEGGYGVSIGRFDAGSSEVEAGDAVADALQGAPQPVPAPRTVAGPVDEDKVRHRSLITTSCCGRLFCHLFYLICSIGFCGYESKLKWMRFRNMTCDA